MICIVISILHTTLSFSQEKYAILITGDQAGKGIPENEQWNLGQDKGEKGYDEFWNDTYLMYETLLDKGFTAENIIVLFADGDDFYIEATWVADRYRPVQGVSVTDYAATKENVELVFNGLANGSNGFSKINEEDFLFVWTFGHGGPGLECGPATDREVYMVLINDVIRDYEFASLTNQINCDKKVFWLLQCYSGGFVEQLKNNNTIIHTSCQPNEMAWPADNIDVYGNYVEEKETISSREYRHSECFFHIYSSINGESPAFIDNYNGEFYQNADLNSDNFISCYESYSWEESHESINRPCPYPAETPMYSDLGNIGNTTTLEYPTIINSNITTNKTYKGIVGMGKDISVGSNKTLTFLTNSKFYLENDARLTINSGSTLNLYDGIEVISEDPDCDISVYGTLNLGDDINLAANIVVKSGATLTLAASETLNLSGYGKITVESGGSLVINNNYTFQGTNTGNAIIVNGNLQIGTGVTFTANTGNEFGGLVLNNNSLTLNINSCNFTRAKITGNSQNLTINSCNFNNSTVEYSYGSVSLSNVNFDYSNVYFTQGNNFAVVSIVNSTFDNYSGNAIYIGSYSDFTIEECTVQNNGGDGIYIYESNTNSGLIKYNTILNNGLSGIKLYNSKADIIENYEISENQHGVICLGTSVSSILGNENASVSDELQQIRDNTANQIYSSSNSFPDDIHYNNIYYYDYTEPLIYHNNSTPVCTLNVKYNFWGRRGVQQSHLYPYSYYDYLPVIHYAVPMPRMLASEAIYKQAQISKENSEYKKANKLFDKVITKYPESSFAEPSLVELLAIEDLSTKNYKELKNYYLNNKSIASYKSLVKLASKLANYCDVKLKNYQKAIEWFENVIENPETLEDSVFAIIDLGNTYFLMENDKSAYTGKRAEYKFNSKAKFEKKREELIEILLAQKGNEEDTNITTDSETEKIQEAEEINSIEEVSQASNFKVFPNPMREEAQIQYSLNEPSQVLIRVFDYSGKEIKVLVNTYQDKGSYQQVFKVDNLNPGIYFYSLELNGQLVKTNKMVIIE